MFKDYKEVFKDLRKLQDRLWQDSMAHFPGAGFPFGMEKMQQDTLSTVSHLLNQAINQSLALQREWLDQWSDRAGGSNLKPKAFAQLSAEAQRSTERWLENQNELWNQWLKLLEANKDLGAMPDMAEWKKAMEESRQAQMKLLEDWSDMSNFKKLSDKEFSKLSKHIAKAMDASITTQQRLWDQWFDRLGEAGKKGVQTAAAKPDAAVKTAKTKAAKTDKTKAKPEASSKQSKLAVDDLQQIKGIGPGLEKKLKDGGIKTLHDLANLNKDDIARLENEVIRFSGRIERDQWIEQAKKLIG